MPSKAESEGGKGDQPSSPPSPHELLVVSISIAQGFARFGIHIATLEKCLTLIIGRASMRPVASSDPAYTPANDRQLEELKMTTKATGFAMAAALCAVLASGATADTINVNFNYAGQTITVDPNTNEIGGLMSLHRNSGSTLPFVKSTPITPSGSTIITSAVGIAAFCIDLLEDVTASGGTYDIIPLADAPNGSGNTQMGATKATQIAQLWREYVNPSASSQLSNSNEGNFPAFQLAMWNILYGTTANNHDAAIQAQADDMLDWLSNNPNAPEADLRALSAPSGTATGNLQDLVVEVPEAANAISLAAIVLAAGFFNFKRLRQRRDAYST